MESGQEMSNSSGMSSGEGGGEMSDEWNRDHGYKPKPPQHSPGGEPSEAVDAR